MITASSRYSAAVLGVIVLAFVFRATAAFTLPLPLQGDAVAYDLYARLFVEHGQLLEIDGTPLTYRPPGYPAFVGSIYWLLGTSVVAVALVQASLDTLLVGLIFLFLRKRFSRVPAWLGAALYALSPAAIFSAGSLLSESVGTFMALAAAALVVRAGEGGARRFAFAAGLMCSGLTLTRSVMVFYPLALAVSFLACLRLPRKTRLQLGGALVVAYMLGLSPWLARNTAAIGSPALSTNGGATLYASWVHPPGQVWGNNVQDPVTAEAESLPALEADRFLRSRAISHIFENPLRAFRLVPEKIAMVLVPLDWEIVGRGRGRSWNPHWVAVALLAAWAWRRPSFRASHSGWIIGLSFASLLVTTVLFYGSPRFRVPFEALLILPAALTLASLASPERGDPGQFLGKSRGISEIPVGHYQRVMESGHPIRRAWHLLKFSRVLDLCNVGPGNLLDVGCFAGSLLSRASETQFPRQVGVDILPEQIQFANTSFGTPYRRFQRIGGLADLRDLEEKFDYATSVEVVEHLRPDEIRTLFVETARVLAPGSGRFVLSTPNYLSMWPVLELLLNRFSDVDYSEQHITRFTFFNFERRIAEMVPECARYFVIEVKTTTHLLTPFLAVFGVEFSTRVGALLPHGTWKNPFGSLVLVRLRRNETPFKE